MWLSTAAIDSPKSGRKHAGIREKKVQQCVCALCPLSIRVLFVSPLFLCVGYLTGSPFIDKKFAMLARETYSVNVCASGACTLAAIKLSKVKVYGRTISDKRIYSAHRKQRNLTRSVCAINSATSSSVSLPYS
jgi:hypothetical protein